jgi:nitric oxide reductase NorQ protein
MPVRRASRAASEKQAMPQDTYFRSYSPRQAALERAQAQAARRPGALDESAAADALLAYRVAHEPYYRPVADEVALYEAAYAVRMPVMLKGPTGCGKTRFVEYMAWKLGRPLVTV